MDVLTTPGSRSAAPEHVREIVRWLDGHGPCIEFPDHGSGADPDGWVTLPEMTDPARAGNNCHAATHEVDRFLVENYGDPDLAFHTVELVFACGVHWANAVEQNGQRFVIDYTARQFDADLPFPYVAPINEWHETIARQVMTQYGDALDAINVN